MTTSLFFLILFLLFKTISQTKHLFLNKQTDGRKDRHTGGRKDRQTDRQTSVHNLELLDSANRPQKASLFAEFSLYMCSLNRTLTQLIPVTLRPSVSHNVPIISHMMPQVRELIGQIAHHQRFTGELFYLTPLKFPSQGPPPR